MPQPDSNTSSAPTTERVDPRTLLADLESRQDELLRLLDELEERTKQAIAQLAPAAPPKSAPPQSTTMKESPPPQSDVKAA